MTDTDTTPYHRREPRQRDLRASDAERDAVAAMLRREHVAGRLDSVEFDERLSRCLAAKSYAELDELIVDLPTENRAPRRSARVSAWPFPLLPIIAVVIAAVLLSHGHLFWLAFPVFFLFVLRPLLWGRRTRSRSYAGRQYQRRAYGGGRCGP
jgi:Flp pilus assembly protein TadB